MHRRVVALALGCFAILATIAAVTRAENWPQWRGPDRDGASHETGLPVQWDKDHNIAWTAKLPGMGSSTPAVWGEHIFLTSEDGDDLVLVCLSTAGKQLWKVDVGAGKKRFMK